MHSVGSLRSSHIPPVLLHSPSHMGGLLRSCLTETTRFDLLISPDVRQLWLKLPSSECTCG